MQILENFTGVNEINNPGLHATVYPTVSNGNFSVAMNDLNNGNVTAEIYNMIGEKVYESTITNPKSQISLNVPDGCYFVWLRTENLSACKKIMIVH